MRRSAELIGIDAELFRVDDIHDAATYTSVKVARIAQKTRCPGCGHIAHIHSATNSTVYHIPYAGKPCLITLKKRRYRCSECKKTFTQDQPLLSALGPHISHELEGFVVDKLVRGATIAELEHITGASKNILTKIEEGARIPACRLPHNLCTDEVRAFPKSYLILQLFFEWPDGTYESRDEMELALKHWISIARRAKVPEMSSVTRTIKQRMTYILNAWEYGRTNAVAESLNRQIKDIIRTCRGFMSFNTLRRRCMLVLGHEREPDKPIPLFTRPDKRKEIEH